ncbi:MAG: hypothetical protein ACP5OE_06275 [Thermodesulfobium sp.]
MTNGGISQLANLISLFFSFYKKDVDFLSDYAYLFIDRVYGACNYWEAVTGVLIKTTTNTMANALGIH